MAAVHKEYADPKTSPDTESLIEKTESPNSNEKLREENGLENLNNHYRNPLLKQILSGIAIMFYGHDQGVMSQVNLNPHYQELMGIASIEGNSRNVATLGGIVAVYYAGTLIGALIADSLADRMGRIKAVVFGALWALLGAVLQASAYNLHGCAALVSLPAWCRRLDCVIPVWSAEVSSHSARGAFLAIEFFMVSERTFNTAQTDISIAQQPFLDIVVSTSAHGNSAIQNIGGLALAYWIDTPDRLHPRHRLRHQLLSRITALADEDGTREEARAVLKATRESEVEYELKGIKKVVKYAPTTTPRCCSPRTGTYSRQLRRVFLAVWLQIMQELVDIRVITVYAVDLLKDAGFDENLSKPLAGFNNISYMFPVIFAVITPDRY
ncbi:MAG: hypothetical protein Q9207_004215 [Kuettlingeria erythrocarpa]